MGAEATYRESSIKPAVGLIYFKPIRGGVGGGGGLIETRGFKMRPYNCTSCIGKDG